MRRDHRLHLRQDDIPLEAHGRRADPDQAVRRLPGPGGQHDPHRTSTQARLMSLRETRERIVREHMESENRHEFDVTMGTFAHPRYEIVPTGDVYDGNEAVDRYYSETRAAFPDQRNELIALHHADDAVLAEFWLKGTHEGELRGFAPTGKEFTCRCLAVFEFEG